MKSFITLEYRYDLLNIYKAHFRRYLLKNISILHDEVVNSLLFEIDEKSIPNEEYDFLSTWFNNVYNHQFLDKIIIHEFEEAIIHVNNHYLLINRSTKQAFSENLLDPEDYQLALDILALKNNQTWNVKEPFVSFNLNYKHTTFRLTLINYSCSPHQQSKAFIRKISSTSLDIFKYYPEELINLVQTMCANKSNVIVSGPTGCGKTTLLNKIISLIPPSEHVITLEDTHELITTNPNFTSLLSNKNEVNKSLNDYCKYAMRMSPDRLIIGEMRSEEVVPFLLSMNTGHRGLLSSVHANSALDTIHRIALLFSIYSSNIDIKYELIIKLICKSIDYIVYMENKQVVEVIKLIGSKDDNPFFETIYSINS